MLANRRSNRLVTIALLLIITVASATPSVHCEKKNPSDSTAASATPIKHCEKKNPSDSPVKIKPGQCHEYSTLVKPGRYWVKVEEGDIDLLISTQDKQSDSPVARQSTENIWINAQTDQTIMIQVRTFASTAVTEGEYTLSLKLDLPADQNSLYAADMTEAAILHYMRGEYSQAQQAYQDAAEAWLKVGNNTMAAYCYHSAAYIPMYFFNDQPEKLEEALDDLHDADLAWKKGGKRLRSLLSQKDIGKVLHLLERNHEAYETLLYVADSILPEPGSRYLQGLTQNELGIAAKELGLPLEALKYYQQSIQLFELNRDFEEANNAKHNLASLLDIIGETDVAVDILENVERDYRQLGDDFGAAAALNVLVDLYFKQGEPRKALKAFDEALKVFACNSKAWESILLLKYAQIETSLGRFENARNAIDKALQWAIQADSKKWQARALLRLAELANQIGDQQQAIELLQTALESIDQNNRTRQYLWLQIKLSESYLQAGNINQSSKHINAALQNIGEFSELEAMALLVKAAIEHPDDPDTAEATAISALNLYKEIQDPLGEYNSLRLIAEIKFNRQDWQAVLDNMQSANNLLNSIAGKFVLPEFRSRYLSQHKDLVYKTIIAYEALATITGTNNTYQIISELEQRRISNLGTQESQWLPRPNNDEAKQEIFEYYRAKEESSTALLNRYLNTINGFQDDRQTLERTLREKQQAQEAIERALFRPLTEIGDKPSVEDFQQFSANHLSFQRAILYFHVGEQDSRAYLLTTDNIYSSVLPGQARLAELVDKSLDYLSDPNKEQNEEFMQISRLLLDIIKPHQLSDILVIRDGPLHYFPFNSIVALRTNESAINAMDINWIYIPSIASARQLALRYEKRNDMTSSNVLLLGDPVTDRDDPRINQSLAIKGLTRLPSAASELNELNTMLNVPMGNLLSGFEANKDQVLGISEHHGIIHIAAHGTIDPNHSASSGVLLSTYDKYGNTIAGHLGANDLRFLNLPVNLVFLNGCTTALGENFAVDGPFGITQSFLQAGAMAVIASYWDVSDRATKKIAIEFYKELKGGLTGPAALRNAMSNIRQIPGYRHPYYWAGIGYHGYLDLQWENF